MQDTSEVLAALVAVPSVNPLLAVGPGDRDERELARYVEQRLVAAGAEVTLQEVDGGRVNVVGHLRRQGETDDAVILLSAHMDTYPAGGPRSAYEAVRDGRLLYGRGAADAKGSLAAMLRAFEDVATSPVRRECYVVATVDEECLLQGVKRLASSGIRATLAITGEPTSLVPVVAQKGIVRGSVHVRGPRAHAAYPTASDAVTAAGALVAAVQRLNAEYAQEQPDAVLGAPTLTLTKVASDGGMNLVARDVTLWFDGRFLPGTTGAEFAAEVESRLRKVLPDDVELTAPDLTFVSPPNRCRSTPDVVAAFLRSVEEVTGRSDVTGFAYGSEAGVLSTFCDDSLVFGPGDAGCSHAPVEVIDVDELETATEVFRRVLRGPGATRDGAGA